MLRKRREGSRSEQREIKLECRLNDSLGRPHGELWIWNGLSWDEMARPLYSCIHPSWEEMWPGVSTLCNWGSSRKGWQQGLIAAALPAAGATRSSLKEGPGVCLRVHHIIIISFEKYINRIYPKTTECISKSGRHRNNFSIKLVGNYWKLYVASPERKHRDIHLPCPPGKLLGEDEIFHPILIEEIVKKYTIPYFHLSCPKNRVHGF